MSDSLTAKSIIESIGNFKLKSLIPFFVGIALGYVFHEIFHDNFTIVQLKGLIDYIALTWQKIK